MGKYRRKDHYYQKAKELGLPSRASFKIEEILKKFPLVGKGDAVLELGAAPGGWTVFLLKAVGPHGRVLALDLQALDIPAAENLSFYQGDLESPEAKDWLRDQLENRKIDAIFSDMSPKLSGIEFKDAYLSYELGLKSLERVTQYLKNGGNFVTKIFPGAEFQIYLKKLRDHFQKVKVFEPQATRKTSREIYLLGIHYGKK